MKDLLYDSTGDMAIEGGDLVVGDSTNQHIEDLVICRKGWYHFDPMIGVGLVDYVNDDIVEYEFVRNLRLELEADGVSIQKLSFDNSKVSVEATYKKQARLLKEIGLFGGAMVQHTVQEKQTLFDIAVQYYLNVDAVSRISALNNLDSFELIEGQTINVDKYSLDPYSMYGIKVKNLMTGVDNINGIGFWTIEENFEIQ